MFYSSRVRAMALSALVLSLAACSISPLPAEQRPPTPALASPPPESSLGEVLPAVDPADVSGATPITVRTSGAGSVRARWVYINGAEPYNERLDTQLFSVLDQNAGGRYDPSDPATASGAFTDGLKFEQELVLAGGTVLGTRTSRSQVSGGIETRGSVTTEFTDLSTGDVQSGQALLSVQGHEAVRPLIDKALKELVAVPNKHSTTAPATAAPAASAPSTVEPAAAEPLPTDALLAGAALNREGELVVPLANNPADATPLDSPVNVHLSAVATVPLLSEFGRRVRLLALDRVPLRPPAPAAPGQEHINCDLVPCVALTYDDGPTPETTRLLDILAKHSVHATFFQQGINAASYPGVAAAVAAAGHSIANHTMHHPYLTKLSADGVAAEIQGSAAIIQQASGVSPAFLRPPYGASNRLVQKLAGVPIVNWSVDSLDWLSRDKNAFIPKVLELVKPGAIVLMHDIHASTVDGQDQLITELQDRGYQLVTVPQLFRGIDMANGSSYFCRGTAYPCTPGR